MSVLGLPTNLPETKKTEVIRPTANYHASVWGDQFITYIPEEEISHAHKQQEVEQLKQVVRRELMTTAGDPAAQLKFIDTVQRLGLAYHFEGEIEAALQHIYDTYDLGHEEDLFSVALWFRLLRQQGHNVSSDVFNKFKCEKGSFKESLKGDVRGMLCLYEAVHLGVHGEFILDEALAFTTMHLEAIVKSSASINPLTSQVIRALKQPTHKGLPRLEARHYISVYQEDGLHNKDVLKLAKLDFNLVQNVHKKELSGITRWWKQLDLAVNLPFARDRVVEFYVWALAVYFEPQYTFARKIFTKVLSMLAVVNDMHDAYATLEELELFSEATQRWDINNAEQLPGHIKLCYLALLELYQEIANDMVKSGFSYRTQYAVEAMQTTIRGYFVEAKWFNEEYIPTMEEYMPNATLYTGYPLMITTSFLGMGEFVTKEAFDWVVSDPKIIRASSIVGRLMDDMAGHKFEQMRGHGASSIECYVKQYGVSEKQVYAEFKNQVVNAWKDINQECLTPTGHVPTSLLKIILNITRAMDVTYKNGVDRIIHNEMKEDIALLLINPC